MKRQPSFVNRAMAMAGTKELHQRFFFLSWRPSKRCAFLCHSRGPCLLEVPAPYNQLGHDWSWLGCQTMFDRCAKVWPHSIDQFLWRSCPCQWLWWFVHVPDDLNSGGGGRGVLDRMIADWILDRMIADWIQRSSSV